MYNRVKSERSLCIPVLSFLTTQSPPQGWLSYHLRRSPLRAVLQVYKQISEHVFFFYLPFYTNGDILPA